MALRHVLGIIPGVWLLWPLLTSAQSHHELLQGALPLIPALLPYFAHTAKAASRYAQACFTSGLTGFLLEQALRSLAGQISPDKDVNFLHTTVAFTISHEPWALLCCANLPGDLALYAVPVCLLIALHSGSPACSRQASDGHVRLSSRRSLAIPPPR